MVRWVTLSHNWSLQDVQAGLNVVITFLCAGTIFILVRSSWLYAASSVIKNRKVPVYSLISLNTIGEVIDITWLLRWELLTGQYRKLLVQCVCVVLLTIATMFSGLTARYSTQNGTTFQPLNAKGKIAERKTDSNLFNTMGLNSTIQSLTDAKVPQTLLLEFLPDDNVSWHYNSAQWNSSWAMDCTYNESTEIPNPRATGNCSSLGAEFPPLYNNYWDWMATPDIANTTSWEWAWTGYRNTMTEWRDTIIFTHGLRYMDYHQELKLYASLEMRTVTIYLENVPWNASLPSTCNFAEGPIKRAFYTSCNCQLSRKVDDRSNNDTYIYWGAYPDGSDISLEVKAHLDFYGRRLTQESSQNRPVPVIEGAELAMFYQAYQITKDTSTGVEVVRKIDSPIPTPQVSLVCVIICAIVALIDVLGISYYWLFLFKNRLRLNETPQSKLDWVLQTLYRKNEKNTTDYLKRRLVQANISDQHEDEMTLLGRTVTGSKFDSSGKKSAESTESRSIISVAQSTDIDHDEDGSGATHSGQSPPQWPQKSA